MDSTEDLKQQTGLDQQMQPQGQSQLQSQLQGQSQPQIQSQEQEQIKNETQVPTQVPDTDRDESDSVFRVFGEEKRVKFDKNLADQQINMNPTEKRIFEPLTGSSVVVDTTDKTRMPENGFPAGYGPNADFKRIEKPKKPKLRERIKRSFGQMTKKQRRLLIIVPSASLVLIIILSFIAIITGVFATDYSKTYSVAKTIRGELQKIRSNAN